MSENGIPQFAGSATIAQNEYVQELFDALNASGKDTAGLTALLNYVAEMENYVKRSDALMADMRKQLSEMKEVQAHPVKIALTNSEKTLESKVGEVKTCLVKLKNAIVSWCKKALTAIKEKGLSALNYIQTSLLIRESIESLRASIEKATTQCDKSVLNIYSFASEYHSSTRALKNMGRILIGKEPIDAKKEAGAIAKSIAAPYKMQKAIFGYMKKGTDKVVSVLIGLEKRQIQKTSLLGELADAKRVAAAFNRENANREQQTLKGAEL
jgi:hypothetical protein